MSSPSEKGEQPIKPPQPQGVPTLKAADPFNPKQDAEALYTAIKGFGTDEKTIIEVLCHRTNTQRQVIAAEFKILYNKDLLKALTSKLRGDFNTLIKALMTPTVKFQAKELNRAMSGIKLNERALVELLCTATNQEIRDMNAAYKQLFGTLVEIDLVANTSPGSFRMLLVSLCKGRRSEDCTVDQSKAVSDAKALLAAGELSENADETTFNTIMSTHSYPQLKQMFVEYQRLTGHNLEEAIQKKFSKKEGAGLLAIIQSIKNKSAFFTEQLYRSMDGLGTWDRTLIRIVSLRSETDMEDIKREFASKHEKSLADFIKDDTTGDYKNGLLTLIKG